MQALREKHGFTQEQLAALLDLRRESLSRIEGGKVALTLPILQRFSRVVTLARGVREHLAWADARGNLPDERHLDTLAVALHLDKSAADEVVLVATMAYERKKREALRTLPSPVVSRRVSL
jgi:transcriptional regulator with XRE-family HTH domain